MPCDGDTKARIRAVFAQQQASLEYLTLLHPWLGNLHAALIRDCLREWRVSPAEVDLVASHGQTIYYAPRHQHQRPDFNLNATLQLGDGDHGAVGTGIITVSDFRQKHLAAVC